MDPSPQQKFHNAATMFWIGFPIEYFHHHNFLFIVIITTKSYSQSICCELTPLWVTQINMSCTRTDMATDKGFQG